MNNKYWYCNNSLYGVAQMTDEFVINIWQPNSHGLNGLIWKMRRVMNYQEAPWRLMSYIVCTGSSAVWELYML